MKNMKNMKNMQSNKTYFLPGLDIEISKEKFELCSYAEMQFKFEPFA